jgi:hypothetical protein
MRTITRPSANCCTMPLYMSFLLSVDDSVLDKPYSHHMALVGHFWFENTTVV